jgi:hypothetical protein
MPFPARYPTQGCLALRGDLNRETTDVMNLRGRLGRTVVVRDSDNGRIRCHGIFGNAKWNVAP